MTLTRPHLNQITTGPQRLDEYLGQRNQNDDAYFRSIVGVIPLLDPDVLALQATYSTTDVPYPQTFCFDPVTGELFITRNGINAWSWVQVYDFPSLTLKRTFTLGYHTGECLIVRYEGATRYLYTAIWTGGNVIRADITTLPPNLSTLTPTDMGVQCFTQMAFDGRYFAVQSYRAKQGHPRRNEFILYPPDFSAPVGRITFPLGATGDLNAYAFSMSKTQAVCFHNGMYVFGCGGDYVTGNHDPDHAYRQPGIRVCNALGDLVLSALSRPDTFLEILNPRLPTGAGNMIENEGVASYGGELYALWMNRSPGTAPSWPAQGMVLTKEFSRDPDRIDFRPSASPATPMFKQDEFERRVHAGATTITDPITGAELDSFADIVGMMRGLGLSRYSFVGTNQSIVDLNNVALTNMAGALFEFVNMDGSNFLITKTALTPTNSRSWWLHTNGTVQVPLANPYQWHFHGTGTPEGSVSAPVGALYSRLDGGAGTTLYVKESGTGNTGWRAVQTAP